LIFTYETHSGNIIKLAKGSLSNIPLTSLIKVYYYLCNILYLYCSTHVS